MIREFIEDQIHIHKMLRLHHRPDTIQLIIQLCVEHALLCAQNLIRHIVHGIARAR